MPKCSPSTLVIGRPTRDAAVNAANSLKCANTLGPTDCLDKNLLTPRHNRDKVREQIRDYIMLFLGAPVLDLELDQQQIDLAIDHALQIIEYYAPREYFDYYTFLSVSGKSVYQLPPDVGYVRNVFYRTMGQFAFQASDLDGAIPIEYFYPGGAFGGITGGLIDPLQPVWGRQGEWVLYKQYEQMYSRVSSGLGGWEWVGGFNNIKLYPVPCRPQHVIVQYIQKNKDWGCVTQSMQEGALAFARIMLGTIRNKYKNIPGPGGGMQLDGAEMLQQGLQEKKEWEERLLYRFGDIPPITMG